jgi:hypothetical protein
VALLPLLCSLPVQGGIQAGAAARSITPAMDPAKPVYMAGFGNNRVATGVHDELYARCLAMRSGGPPVVLCSVDSIGLFFDDVQKIRAGVPQAQVIVAATHSHETPDTLGLWGPSPGVSGINEEYNALVVRRTIEAAQAALKSMRGAKLTITKTHPPELASYMRDSRPPVLLDDELVILRLTRGNGRGIATLINWANHPEALGSKNTLLTADFPWALARDTESRLGGVTIFVNGSLGGLMTPLGVKVRDPRYNEIAPPDSFRLAEVIGNQVADLVVDTILKTRPSGSSKVTYQETLVKIPVSNPGFVHAAAANLDKGRKAIGPDKVSTTPVGLLRIMHRGKPLLEAAAIPGELYPELSLGGVVRYPGADFPDAPIEPGVKTMMKAPYRMVLGLTNDEIGYIIPKAEWDNQAPWLNNATKRLYGEVNSIGPEAAPVITQAVKELLSKP